MIHESAQVLLPRFVRRSRLYEATAKNALRIAVEAVGRVEPQEPQEISAQEITKRKAAGNVVELGSIAAFGFSPLWLLAAASDAVHGSRVYLASFVDELKRAGVLAEEREIGSVDELLETLENASGRTARLIDVPPLELAELRSTLSEFRADASGLPGPRSSRPVPRATREAARERGSLLEVSVGMGMAFLLSARNVTNAHLAVPYREDWAPLRARASPPTLAGWEHRTPGRSAGTSTRSAPRGRSGCFSSWRRRDRVQARLGRATPLAISRKVPTVTVGTRAAAASEGKGRLPTWETTTWIAVGASALAALLLAPRSSSGRRASGDGGTTCRTAFPARARAGLGEARRERGLHAGPKRAPLAPPPRRGRRLGFARGRAAARPRGGTGLGESAAAMLVLPRAQGEPARCHVRPLGEESSRDLLGLPPGGSAAPAR